MLAVYFVWFRIVQGGDADQAWWECCRHLRLTLIGDDGTVAMNAIRK